MLTAICVVIFLLIFAATWLVGLWNNVITLVNLILAGMIASDFYEPLADTLDGGTSTYTYLLDFVCLWGLFFVTFALMRTITDLVSRNRVEFNKWVEQIGRTLTAATIAWIFLCFALFTLHTAPLPLQAFQEEPDTRNFVGGPDRLWLAFLQSRSRGALAESTEGLFLHEYDSGSLHPEDRDLNVRVFDSKSDYIFKYHDRRKRLGDESQLRVNR